MTYDNDTTKQHYLLYFLQNAICFNFITIIPSVQKVKLFVSGAFYSTNFVCSQVPYTFTVVCFPEVGYIWTHFSCHKIKTFCILVE